MGYRLKQVIIVRTDLKMSKGKIASQVAHASVSSFYETLKLKPEYAYEWLSQSQPKIVLKVNSLDELLKVKRKADELGAISVIIRDAGLTEIPPGEITCIGIGPAPKDLIDKLTEGLSLL
ncbi:MAG: peptidyl-tRNA hydrolase Pth2 [Candidatus Geothermarchaeota archaeon]